MGLSKRQTKTGLSLEKIAYQNKKQSFCKPRIYQNIVMVPLTLGKKSIYWLFYLVCLNLINSDIIIIYVVEVVKMG